MATHHDDEGDGRLSLAQRARLSRRLRQIAEALGVPVASFFGPVKGEKSEVPTEERPQQPDAPPRKK